MDEKILEIVDEQIQNVEILFSKSVKEYSSELRRIADLLDKTEIKTDRSEGISYLACYAKGIRAQIDVLTDNLLHRANILESLYKQRQKLLKMK